MNKKKNITDNYATKKSEIDGEKLGCNLSCNLNIEGCNQNFPQRIKKMRAKHDLSQKDLAKKVGVTTYTIQRYEGGKLPSGNNLLLISNVLGCSIDWLLTGKGQPEGHSPPHEKPEPPPERTESAPPASELITKTLEILESDTVYTDALSANIQAFHHAVRTEDRLRDMQEKTENRFSRLEEEMDALKKENKELKEKIEDQDQEGGGATADAG